MKTYTVTERRKYLAAHELGSTTVTKYTTVKAGHPAINQRLNMTEVEAEVFGRLLAQNATRLATNTPTKLTTYTITEENGNV